MPRYSDLYKEIYKRDATSFPPPFNKLIKIGKSYRLKILTDPRNVTIPYGRKAPICEVLYKEKEYTLYFSLVDMHDRMAVLEKEETQKSGKEEFTFINRTIILKQISPRRFEIKLEPEQPKHEY